MENTTNQQDEKGHDANIVLAVSGLTESFLLGKLEGYIHKRDGYKEGTQPYGCYDLLVREFTQLLQMCQAASANGGEAQGVSDGLCYKSGEPCRYGCAGLCKESC